MFILNLALFSMLAAEGDGQGCTFELCRTEPGSTKCTANAESLGVVPISESSAQAACIDKLGPELLAKVRKEDVQKLSPEVLSLLSPQSQLALGKIAEVTRGESAAAVMLRDRNAIKPSLRVVGDAFGRVATGNDADDAPKASSDGAFGGGLDVRTLDIRASLMIKKGTQPAAVTGETAFGTTILLPQTENVAVSTDFTWFPDWYNLHCRATEGNPKTWCHRDDAARNAWRYQMRRSLLLGPSLMVDVASTKWKHIIDPEQSVGGVVMTPETAVTGQVTTFHAALGARYSWLRSHNENWVEVSVFAGGSWRGVRADSAADKEFDKLRGNADMLGLSGNEYLKADNFLASALGTPQRNFFGVDLGLSVRVNDVVVSAMLPYVAGHQVSGLDGFRFIPMLSLRAGFELVNLSTEAKAPGRSQATAPAPKAKANAEPPPPPAAPPPESGTTAGPPP